jgi:hypothetical protein
MLLVLHRLLAALTIFAFIGGMTTQATPSAAALGLPGESKTDAGCPYMAMHQQDAGDPEPVKRGGMDADCIKQMGCLGTALPLRPGELPGPVAYSKVTYCLSPAPRVGGWVEPELLPPIGM